MAWWRKSGPPRGWGILLLAVLLIAAGVFQLFPNFDFPASRTVLAVLAIVAGAALLTGR